MSIFFPFSHKSNVSTIFITFHKFVEHQLQRPLKALQTDGVGEFIAVTPYLKSHGILHCITCPHTNEQNGAIEQCYKHVVELGLALLAHESVPLCY